MVDSDDRDSYAAESGETFRYHLELTPAQLKITHTALRSLLDDFGHEEHDVGAVIHEVLAKFPDEHSIRAIVLEDERGRERGAGGAPSA
jgi:hypothetical protein